MINLNTPLPDQNKEMYIEQLKWDQVFWYYFDTFYGIAQIVYDYDDMPDTVDIEFMERWLLQQGYCFFFQDPVLDYLALGGTFRDLNVYGKPSKFEARGQDGRYFNPDLNWKNCVMIYDNVERVPIMNNLAIQANRLADMVIAAQANIRKQKTPYIIAADQDTLLTVQNILRDINANLPEVIVKKGFNKEDLQVWQLTAPLIVKDIREEFNACFNETLTYIGIPNVQMQKRERMISDEVNRSLGGVEANSYRRFITRKRAVEKINKMFNLDIKVKNNFWEGNAAADPDDLILGFDMNEGGAEDE